MAGYRPLKRNDSAMTDFSRHGEAKLGKLLQVGITVLDLERTMEYLEKTLGLGPWLAVAGNVTDCVDRGREIEIEGRVGMCFSGGVQLEMAEIQEGDAVQTEYLGGLGQGLHHLAFDTVDFERTLDAMRAKGVELLQKGRDVSPLPVPFHVEHAYFDATRHGGMIFEVAKNTFFDSLDIQYRLRNFVPLRILAWIRKALCWIPFLRAWERENPADVLEARSRGLNLGRLSSVRIIVEDLDSAVEHYQRTFGIGPWFETRGYVEGNQAEEGPPAVRARTAIASTGPVSLEVFQVLKGEVPRPGKRVEGLHSLCFEVNDIDEKVLAFEKEGMGVIRRGTISTPHGQQASALLDLTGECGMFIELRELRLAGIRLRGYYRLLNQARRVLGLRPSPSPLAGES